MHRILNAFLNKPFKRLRKNIQNGNFRLDVYQLLSNHDHLSNWHKNIMSNKGLPYKY